MPDLRDLLDAEAGRVRGGAEALGSVLRRARRRRRTRRIASGAVALAVAGASFALAYAAFWPGGDARPADRPLPAPTPTPTSDDETPPPLGLALVNGTGGDLAPYAAARLRFEGIGIRDGGYRIVEGSGLAEAEAGTYEVTTLFCHPLLEDEALLLRDALFPGAEIRGSVRQDRVTVILGEDFARANADALRAFGLVAAFMDRRLDGRGAESFLSEDAAGQYDERFGGLSLYGYTAEPGTAYEIVAFASEAAGYRAIVRIVEEGSQRQRHEQLRIGPGNTATDGFAAKLLVVNAERNE